MDILSGILWYGVFVLSTTLHEASHATPRSSSETARPTTAARSRSTRCRTFRREPVGMVVVPILSFVLQTAGS